MVRTAVLLLEEPSCDVYVCVRLEVEEGRIVGSWGLEIKGDRIIHCVGTVEM